MWRPTAPITYRDRELTDLKAWVYVFAHIWQELEHDPEDLRMAGFNVFGPAAGEKHGGEDPAEVARRLYPEAGEYHVDLYPGDADHEAGENDDVLQTEPAPRPEFGLQNSDVPF